MVEEKWLMDGSGELHRIANQLSVDNFYACIFHLRCPFIDFPSRPARQHDV